MSQILRAFVVLSIAAAVLTACDSSPTITSPTQQAASNRISGSFVSGTAGAARQTAAPRSTFDGIRVSVRQNASISVEVRSNGTFTLEDVPGGTVTLLFTRDGTPIGEVVVQGLGSNQVVHILLELMADDTVILIDVQRSSDDNTSNDDDSSEDVELELELSPDKWCPERGNDNSSDDNSSDDSSSDDNSDDDDGLVFATIKGDSINDVDLGSITMVGPSGEVSPTSVELKRDRIEVIFDMSVAIQVISGVAEGQRVTIQIIGQFQDGTPWELTESIRVKCDDDDNSDDSSG